MSEDLLKQATDLLKGGEKAEAERLVKQYLRENREEPRGWWVLANATSDPELKRKSLVQLLKIKPDFDKAQQMLATLEGSSARTTTEMLSPAPPKTPSTSHRGDADQDWFFGQHANPTPEMLQQYQKESPSGFAMSQTTLFLVGGGGLIFLCCCSCLLLALASG